MMLMMPERFLTLKNMEAFDGNNLIADETCHKQMNWSSRRISYRYDFKKCDTTCTA